MQKKIQTGSAPQSVNLLVAANSVTNGGLSASILPALNYIATRGLLGQPPPPQRGLTVHGLQMLNYAAKCSSRPCHMTFISEC